MNLPITPAFMTVIFFFFFPKWATRCLQLFLLLTHPKDAVLVVTQ